MTPRFFSQRFPYLPVELLVRQYAKRFEALIDTGFDGDLVVPAASAGYGTPNYEAGFVMADGHRLRLPSYRGILRLGPFTSFPVSVVPLGNDFLVGRRVVERFTVILDHGRQVIVEA